MQINDVERVLRLATMPGGSMNVSIAFTPDAPPDTLNILTSFRHRRCDAVDDHFIPPREVIFAFDNNYLPDLDELAWALAMYIESISII